MKLQSMINKLTNERSREMKCSCKEQQTSSNLWLIYIKSQATELTLSSNEKITVNEAHSGSQRGLFKV